MRLLSSGFQPGTWPPSRSCYRWVLCSHLPGPCWWMEGGMDLDRKWRCVESELWRCTWGLSQRECSLVGTAQCMLHQTRSFFQSDLCSHFLIGCWTAAMHTDLDCKSKCLGRTFPDCRTRWTWMARSQKHIEWCNCRLTKSLCPLCSSGLLRPQCHLEHRKDLLCTRRFPQRSGYLFANGCSRG